MAAECRYPDRTERRRGHITNWNSLQCIENEFISSFGVNSAIWLPSYSALLISFDDEYSSDSKKNLLHV